MAKNRQTDDRIEESDEALAPATSRGGEDVLLVGAGGRADIAGDLIDEDEDVGEYKGEDESLAPDYEYRVSTAVSDRYGEYPAPGDDDLPLGYTTDERLATEEGLSYFPPDDPATLPSDVDEEGLAVAAGYAASARDAGYEREDWPDRIDGNDADLADDVVEAIQITSLLTGYRLRVEVEDGVAYLSGVVSTFDDLARVSSIVHSVTGIEDVDDEDLDISDESIEGVREVVSAQALNDNDLE